AVPRSLRVEDAPSFVGDLPRERVRLQPAQGDATLIAWGLCGNRLRLLPPLVQPRQLLTESSNLVCGCLTCGIRPRCPRRCSTRSGGSLLGLTLEDGQLAFSGLEHAIG